MSQLQSLARHLSKGKSISPVEAKEVYGITRLAARVHDLQPYGWVVSTLHRDEAGKKYARYQAADRAARAGLRDYLEQ